MALIGNRSVLLKSPGRFLSGTVASIERSNFATAGQLASRFQAMSPILGGIPNGHLSPSSWALPRTAGALSAVNAGTFAIAPAALNLAAGINIEGDSTITFSLPNADLQLVVSASGTATITITQTGLLAGALQAAGGATMTFTSGAITLGALINAIGAGTFSLTGSATPRATGALAGDITPFTELSPQNLAAAVWSAVAAEYNDSGTMGNKLNAAGSGGVDLTALATAVWERVLESGYTAEELMRLLTAVAAGKTDIDTSGPNPIATFRDLNDTKDRVTATMTGSERTAVTKDLT